MQHALIEVFKKQRPGEPPTVDNSRALVRSLFFDPKRYDLTKVGRYKLDARLGLSLGSSVRTLTNPRFTGRISGMTDDLVELIRRLVALPIKIGLPEDSKDFAADGATMPARRDRRRSRRVRALRQPAPAHGRRAHPGGLPHRPLPDGARRPRADEHRGRGHDHAADDHQHPPGGRGAEGVLRLVAALAVHGPDQLAGRAHPPAPPVGARSRRPHPRARAHRGARRPPDPLRAHVPDRDPGGPEHRPDRLAGQLRDPERVRVHPDAVPPGDGRRGDQGRRAPRRHAGGAQDRSPRRTPRSTRRAVWWGRSCAARAASRSSRTRPTSSTWTSRRSRSCRWRPRSSRSSSTTTPTAP